LFIGGTGRRLHCNMKTVGFEELVGRIYEAAMDPELWPSVIHDVGQYGDAVAGALLAARSDHWVGWRCSPGTPPGIDDYLRSAAVTHSQLTPLLVQANRAGFVPDQDMMSDDQWLADPAMTEYATAAGLHHAAATAIHVPTGDLVILHLHRRAGLPKFDSQTLAQLDAFRPHLARAALLAVRWRLGKVRAAAEALALVGLPAAIVDLRGRVLVANELIQKVASWTHWLPDDRIALVDKGANELLQRAISELRDPVAPSARSIPIKPTATTGAAVVHVVPVTGGTRDLFLGAFGILVITPVEVSGSPAASILQALFDLTPSEVRVAQAIAEGVSLDRIASRHAVAIGTVRAQSKAVLSKTGLHSQAQVAALLAGLPKLPAG